MNQITIYKYQTADGLLFDTEEEAVQHEIRKIIYDCIDEYTDGGETNKYGAADEITKRLDVRLRWGTAMNQIPSYQTKDDPRFETKTEAISHEATCAERDKCASQRKTYNFDSLEQIANQVNALYRRRMEVQP